MLQMRRCLTVHMVYMLICDPRLCRRAAHFAYFDADEEGDISAVHAGGDDIRRLGPINSTYELAEGIEVARAVREEKLRASRAQAVEAATWHPSRDVGLGPRHSSLVPTLEDLALGVVVDFIEDVESIDGLPDAIRVRSETGEVILVGDCSLVGRSVWRSDVELMVTFDRW